MPDSPQFTPDQALAVLNEAKAGGWEDQEIPDDEPARLARAEWWVNECYKARDKLNMNNDTVHAIIRMAEEAGYSAPATDPDGTAEQPTEESPPVEEQGAATAPESTPPDPAPEPEPEEPAVPAPQPAAGSDGVPHLKEKLPIPPELEGDVPIMPRDVSAANDREVRRYHAEFGAYLARAGWLISVETNDLAAAETMLKKEERRALAEAEKIDPNTEKPKLAAVLEAEVAALPKVVEWAERVERHKATLTSLKALRDIYAGFVDRCSREWTMRSEEHARAR